MGSVVSPRALKDLAHHRVSKSRNPGTELDERPVTGLPTLNHPTQCLRCEQQTKTV